MNGSTIIIAGIVAVIFGIIVVNEVRKFKSGKGSCSCGGSCGNCGLCNSNSCETKRKE